MEKWKTKRKIISKKEARKKRTEAKKQIKVEMGDR